MSELRVLIVGGGSGGLSAAVVAALAGAARVTVLAEPGRQTTQGADTPDLLQFTEDMLVAEMPELRPPHAAFGPPKRGKKGKVRRW